MYYTSLLYTACNKLSITIIIKIKARFLTSVWFSVNDSGSSMPESFKLTSPTVGFKLLLVVVSTSVFSGVFFKSVRIFTASPIFNPVFNNSSCVATFRVSISSIYTRDKGQNYKAFRNCLSTVKVVFNA